MRLFSNRLQMTSKCGKKKEVAHEPQMSVSLMFLLHFDFFSDQLQNRLTAAWNLDLFYTMKREEKTAWLFEGLC